MSPNNLQQNFTTKTADSGKTSGKVGKAVTTSSFPGVVYSGDRGVPFPNIFDWLEGI